MAYEWSNRRPKATRAVIIFEMDTNNIFNNKVGKEFNEPDEDWRKLVRFFRFGKDIAEVNRDYDKAEELEELDFIFGPIADRKIRLDKTWRPEPFVDPLKFQLCICNRNTAKAFFNNGKNVKEVIFFCDT